MIRKILSREKIEKRSLSGIRRIWEMQGKGIDFEGEAEQITKRN